MKCVAIMLNLLPKLEMSKVKIARWRSLSVIRETLHLGMNGKQASTICRLCQYPDYQMIKGNENVSTEKLRIPAKKEYLTEG